MYHHNSKDFSHEFVEKSKSGVIPKPKSPPICSGPPPHALFFPCNFSCTFLLHSFGVSFRSFHPMDNLDRPKYKLVHPMAYIPPNKMANFKFHGVFFFFFRFLVSFQGWCIKIQHGTY